MITKEDYLNIKKNSSPWEVFLELLKERDNLLELNKAYKGQKKTDEEFQDSLLAKIEDLEARNKILEVELLESARLHGIGSSREAKLIAEIEGLKKRNAILESSKTTKEFADDLKKLFEQEKEWKNAYREVAIINGGIEVDAEAQEIMAEKKK